MSAVILVTTAVSELRQLLHRQCCTVDVFKYRLQRREAKEEG